MKIAVIGTHGVGKTTLCNKLQKAVSAKGCTSAIITEKARQCPYGINEDMCYETSKWIICTQIKEEMDAEAQKIDYIICDRSCADTLLYLRRTRPGQLLDFRLEGFALLHLQTYNRIVLITKSYDEIEDDGTRCLDKSFQEEIDAMFVDHFMGYATHTFPGSSVFDEQESEEICQIILS